MKCAARLSLGLIFAVVGSLVCRAQTTIDVAKITCEQLTLMKVADPDHIALWLSGYFSAKLNKTTVDVERLKEHAKEVKTYCLYNNKGTVMQAVESLLAKEK
jgi:hypothetical protein